MGRFAVQFDPPGYQYAAEPGLDFLIDGAGLYEKFAADTAAAGQRARDFWNPPGTPWILCRPRQMNPNWYQDLRLSDHVLRSSSWSWAAGITPVEFEFGKTPDASYPDNQWLSVAVGNDTASLDSRDYDAMTAAAGVTLPTGLVTIGFCGETPAGDGFSAEPSQLCPYIQWLHYPPPHDVFVFGFAQVAIIAYRDTFYVLKALDSGGQSWELVGQRPMGAGDSRFAQPVSQVAGGSVVQAAAARPDVRALLTYGLGFNDLYVLPGAGEGAALPLRHLPEASQEPLLLNGPFWVAAMPGQLLTFQAQIVGFELADSQDPASPAPAPWLNLSEYYKPSVAPAFQVDSLLYIVAGGDPPVTTINADGSVTVDSPSIDSSIVFGLVDEEGVAWDFDAAETYQGSLYLTLLPGWVDSRVGGFLSPQVRHIEFRFPVVLEDRENTLLELDDTKFGAIEAEVFRRDPLGKRVRIELLDPGLEVLSATGHDRRANYPVHICEDVDNDGDYETVRVAAWLKEFTLTELRATHPVTGDPIIRYQLELHGLLSRTDQAWLFLPQMVDPESVPPGTVEHTFAVSTPLEQSGFDITDAAVYLAQVDPHAGEDLAQLPGTWGRTPGVLGRVTGNAWGPTWQQTKMDYMLEISRRLRGWVLYETLAGLVRYHDDLLLDLQRGAEYSVSALLYPTHAAAISASAPRQVYLTNARLNNEEPVANVVRVSGEDESLSITPQVLERDELSISDKTYEHFLGEPVVYAPPLRQAVELKVMKVLCRLLVHRLCRRRFRRGAEVTLAPWETLPAAVELAEVVQLGSRGDFLIDHLQWRLLKSHATLSQHRTTFTLLSLPSGAVEGTGTGAYPGRAVVV